MGICNDYLCPHCSHPVTHVTGSDYRADDGTFVPLPHPGESFAPKPLGTTFDRAQREGRIHSHNPYLCTDCGAVSYHRRFDPYFAGPLQFTLMVGALAWLILAGLFLLAAYLVNSWVGSRLGFSIPWWSAAAAPALILVPGHIRDLVIVARHKRRAAAENPPLFCSACAKPLADLFDTEQIDFDHPVEVPSPDGPTTAYRTNLACERCTRRGILVTVMGMT